jgi:hypothetical protein
LKDRAKSIHLVGASLEVGELHYVSSGICWQHYV